VTTVIKLEDRHFWRN